MKINCNKNIKQNKQNIESNANINKIEYKEGSKYFIQSPLNYTGSKFRLLSQLLSLFPTNIRNFVDLFCYYLKPFLIIWFKSIPKSI